MLVFLDFDTQNDLIWDWGKFPIKGFINELTNLVDITSFIRNNNSALHIAFGKSNRYSSSTMSKSNEPRHCELGSTGASKIAESVSSHVELFVAMNEKIPAPSITDFAKSSSRPNKPYLMVEHGGWDAFSNKKLPMILSRLKEQLSNFQYVLYGVPLDGTILNFIKAFREADKTTPLYLITDLTRSLNPDYNPVLDSVKQSSKDDKETTNAFLEDISKSYNVTLVTTKQLLTSAQLPSLKTYDTKAVPKKKTVKSK
jgi:hypothetical protein